MLVFLYPISPNPPSSRYIRSVSNGRQQGCLRKQNNASIDHHGTYTASVHVCTKTGSDGATKVRQVPCTRHCFDMHRGASIHILRRIVTTRALLGTFQTRLSGDSPVPSFLALLSLVMSATSTCRSLVVGKIGCDDKFYSICCFSVH